MKEILVVSGKGGTGKTSITAALASLFKTAVLADCDVDAADMHLILKPEILSTHDFMSGHEAVIRQEDCIACGQCSPKCRFEAIRATEDGTYAVDPFACEGCGVCVWTCPVNAIEFPESHCGQWFESKTRFGTMIHAKLSVAAENSGKLVSQVRQEAKRVAEEEGNNIILIDGPPGIGCPVIASMTGVNTVLLVTEPTLSGIHDMERVIDLTKHFGIDVSVCINKYDVNHDLTKNIERNLVTREIPLLAKVPYDKAITAAQIEGKSVVEYSDSPAAREIKKLFEGLKEHIKEN